MVTYPDVFVRCGPLADEAIECADPVVVFEVLSPSTRSEDLVRKRWAYQAIPALAHLVYFDAGRVEVEIATRAPDGRWWSVFLEVLAGGCGWTPWGSSWRSRTCKPAPVRAAEGTRPFCAMLARQRGGMASVGALARPRATGMALARALQPRPA
jgi:hypothetical protein